MKLSNNMVASHKQQELTKFNLELVYLVGKISISKGINKEQVKNYGRKRRKRGSIVKD